MRRSDAADAQRDGNARDARDAGNAGSAAAEREGSEESGPVGGAETAGDAARSAVRL